MKTAKCFILFFIFWHFSAVSTWDSVDSQQSPQMYKMKVYYWGLTLTVEQQVHERLEGVTEWITPSGTEMRD